MAYTFSGAMVSGTGADVIFSALQKLAIVAPGETVATADNNFGLEELQRVIDQFNAQREAIFSRTFQQYTLIPNHAPHTIGPTGDLNTGPAANYRPVNVASANFILNSGSSNPIDAPRIQIVDKDWWAAQPLKSLQNSVVTHLYYDPALPNGNLNFWPVCNVASPVRLELWNSLSQALATSTDLGFAPGYWSAIVLTLACNMASAYGPRAIQIAGTLEQKRLEALRVIFGNNDQPPKIDLSSGTPRPGGQLRPDFDFLTGLNDN